jgi:hypothetical protein
MKLIQTQTLTSSQPSITFSSIPQTFTDLYVLVSSRSDGAFTSSEIDIAFNGSSSNFSGRYLYGAGSGSGSTTTDTTMVGSSSANNNTANTFGNASIYIPNYTSSNNKSISSDTVGESNATTAYMSIHAVLWSQTAAITSLTLSLDSGARNFVSGSSVSLYGISNAQSSSGAKATGGSIKRVGDYIVHTFTSSGSFVPTENLTNVEYLVIAGGGGGGYDGADPNGNGGGGAGGYRCSVVGESSGGGGSAETRLSLTSGTSYTVTIGAGGTGSTAPTNNGTSTVFGSITATGGGGGGQYNSANGGNGGSGGGGAGFAGAAGTGTANQGYNGGAGINTPAGGNGGGAGSAATSTNGGNGLISYISGVGIARAGGGAGNGARLGVPGSGGAGPGTGTTAQRAGGTNSGSGGGAGLGGTSPGAGGSGIVIVRYAA